MDLRITPISAKQNTNFKQVTCIQIQKNAFANPENVRECSEIFTKKLDAVTGDKRSVVSSLTKHTKTANVLESMSYFMAKDSMSADGLNYSIEWAAQNTGLPIKKTLDENYHSFYVFTKEHIAIFRNALLKTMNLKEYTEEGKSKYPNDPNMSVLYALAKYGVEVDKILESKNAYKPTETIKLNSMDGLDSIVDKLGI